MKSTELQRYRTEVTRTIDWTLYSVERTRRRVDMVA